MTFTVTHGLGITPTSVTITAGNSASSILCYSNNYTATTFDIVFLTAPVSGTNNVIMNWQANK